MAIQGRKKLELSISTVLERTTPYEIYKHFFGDFEPNQVTCNKYRGDKSPSFVIGNKYGELTHFDYGASDYWKGDCFAFVKQLNGNSLSLDEVLRLIDKELNLGIASGSEVRNSLISPINEPEIVSKRNTLIQVITRKFTKEELSYWNTYYQDITDLHNNNIYSIKTIYLNKKKFPLNESDLRFGYFYPQGGYWKIYFPYKEKRKKWMGNVPLQTTYGKERLEKGKNTLICKSLKDWLVCTKVYSHCIQIQNESLAAISQETADYIKDHTNITYYGGDSDEQGKRASYAITEKWGYKHINPPDSLLDCCKDFADMAKFKGLKLLNEHFVKKGLI